jgi:hypothetical protein
MKKTLYALHAAILLTVSLSFAQTTVVPGDGTLAAAILSAQPGDILELIGGAEYTHSSSGSIAVLNKPMTIRVKPGSTQKAIIRLADSASASRKYYFFMIMDGTALTMKGLEIHGLLNGVPIAMSMIKFDGSPNPTVSKIGTMKFEDCVFHDFIDNIVHGMTAATCTGLIQDSLFIDNVIVYNASAFLQYKHVSLRHLELRNSTMYRLEGMALKIGKEFNYRQTKITPTGFIDHCTFDDMGGPLHGHIQVDNAYSSLTVSNCIISNQDVVVNQPALYFLDPMVDTAVIIRSTCFWKCGPPNSYTGSSWKGYVFQDSTTMNPEYRDPANGDFTLPSNSPLLTFGTDGGPIGDPRWAINGPTNREETLGAIPGDTYLSQNYPNPFNPSTTISYRLSVDSKVWITIHDLLGREVVQLVNAEQTAGRYSVVWDAKSQPSGMYVCRLAGAAKGDMSQFVDAKKFLLLR